MIAIKTEEIEEMPKSCAECMFSSPISSASPWKKYCDVNCKDITDEFDSDSKRSDCPLVEIEEPFMNLPCVASEACEHDLMVVLDKIRAEIDAESAKSLQYPNWERAKALEWSIEIIDKYREVEE